MYDHGDERIVNWDKIRFLVARLRFFLSGGEEAWVVGSVTAVLSVTSCMLSSCAMMVFFGSDSETLRGFNRSEKGAQRLGFKSFGTKMPFGGQFGRAC